MSGQQPTAVIVPGLRGPVADHWQSHLAAVLPKVCVVPELGRDHYDLDERVAALDEAVTAAEGPVVIVAHSAGVITTVHWAARHGRPVQGALLATPPDLVSPLGAEYPSLAELERCGWLPVPLGPLPFPSIVAFSLDDALGDPSRVIDLALGWNSDLHHLGAVGHLNPGSGYGQWPEALALLERFGVTAGAVG